MNFDLALAIELVHYAAEYSGSTTANDKASYDALVWHDSRKKPSWKTLQSKWKSSDWASKTKED